MWLSRAIRITPEGSSLATSAYGSSVSSHVTISTSKASTPEASAAPRSSRGTTSTGSPPETGNTRQVRRSSAFAS